MYQNWRLCPEWVQCLEDPEEGASQPHTWIITGQSPIYSWSQWKTNTNKNGYSVSFILLFLFTLALPCDPFLVWQRDVFPAGTAVFSAQSTETSVSSPHYQVPCSPPVGRCVLDLAPALAPVHLQTGRGNGVIHKSRDATIPNNGLHKNSFIYIYIY